MTNLEPREKAREGRYGGREGGKMGRKGRRKRVSKPSCAGKLLKSLKGRARGVRCPDR